MPTYTGTASDNSWTLKTPGTFTLDGLAGTDTLDLGTSLRSAYTITQSGSTVHIDSVSGASAALHATLYNMEKLYFNSGKDLLDLTTYFGDTTPPTLASSSPTNQSTGVAVGSDLVANFSESVQKGSGTITLTTANGTTVASYDVATSPNITVSGSKLTVNPTNDLLGGTAYALNLSAGSVKDAAGNAFAGTKISFTTAVPTMTGSTGNDVLTAAASGQAIDALSGIDTVVFSGARSGYSVTKTGTGFTVSDNTQVQGSSSLSNVERLQFADKKLALDLGASDSGGRALEFIGVLAPSLLTSPSTVGAILGVFDQGKSMLEACQLAISLGLVASLAGSASNADLASLVYRNVLGAQADAATVDSLVAYMDGRAASFSQAEFMATIAALELNQNHVGLTGLQQTGVEYL